MEWTRSEADLSESGLSEGTDEFFSLAKALGAFKAGPLSGHPSDRALANAAGVSATTIGDWLRGKRFPQDTSKILIVVRMVRDAAADRGIIGADSEPRGLLDDDQWRTAHKEEAQRRAGVVSDEVKRAQATSVLSGSSARVRVGEVDPRRLGVHAAITVPGVPDDVPPEYVPRDVDAAEFGVRAKVKEAAQRGGFVLLVGGSSVGKTRCAAEAVKALLPDWWLVHPDGPAEVTVLAQAPPQRTVMWLNELQDYLDGEDGLTGAVVRALLDAAHPAVIIGTLWPDRYAAYTAVPVPGAADPHARERQVLDLAAVIRIDPEFSAAEQDRARAAAGRDRRLAVALETAGYGLTQTLAAAPQLVARWEDAKTASPYAWAVLTAALDVARLGARAPLSTDFLRAAAPGYCTKEQQAEAPKKWFKKALAYATAKLHGAAAALSPAGAGMGQTAGYTAADYLIQHASRERRSARVPASTWDAILSYIRDPADAAELADSARNRLLYTYAIPLYRHATDAGHGHAAWQLAWLLAERGDLDEATQIMEARADAGDVTAVIRLERLLTEFGDLDRATQVLDARADAGDKMAAFELARLLAKRGDLDGLRARADAGNVPAALQMADLLTKRRDHDGAEQILRPHAAGNAQAARALATLLAWHNLEGAAQILRPHADVGGKDAVRKLNGLLARLLARRGDLDGLRARADAGDEEAPLELARLLEWRGDLDGAKRILRARADAGDQPAAHLLAELLGSRGDLDELRARADAGDKEAVRYLAWLLAASGDQDGAEQILRAGADASDSDAVWRLVDLLTERGDLDGAEQILSARANAGGEQAAFQLARLLAERGDLDGLRARADAGDVDAASQLARLLAERGDLDGLRARADAGDEAVAGPLSNLLIKQGHGEEAERLRRFGLNPDGSIACG
jgi:hypothetical protein